MCGIAGIFAYNPLASPVDREELLRIREQMIARGPDGAGLWISEDARVGLAHRRLAIIDLYDSGAQPMWNAEHTLCVTFNGEIYNYQRLRKELERKGYRFRSSSDTEVLLHLYAERGADMVHALRGMFAFGIWDQVKRTLFLARDPFGIKPLYYADDGRSLRFASQVKALLAGRVDATPEPAGSVGFLLWGSVPEPYTLYRGIRALPAGSYLCQQAGAAASIVEYFSIHDELVQAEAQKRPFREDDREALGEMLRDSVHHHLVADVPVAVFLSAGVDSTVIASLAVESQNASLRTLTLGFEEYRGTNNDEVPLAARTAASLGTRHEAHWIQRADFQREMHSILGAMDQPSIDGVNSYLICRESARVGIKVALSGLGGDEILGGYPSFRDVPRLAKWLWPARHARLAGRLARVCAAPIVSRITSSKFAGLLEYGGTFEGAYLLRRALYLPWELGNILDPLAMRVGLEALQTLPTLRHLHAGVSSPYAKVAALEACWYMRNQLLRDVDWAGMAHSLEVRVPFVDAVLFRALAPWLVSPRPPSKVDAAKTPRAKIAEDIIRRPKSGFSVPVREWLVTAAETRKEAGRGLRGWALRILPSHRKQRRTLVLVTDAYGSSGGIAKFNRDFIEAMTKMPQFAEVVVIPRIVSSPVKNVPSRVRFVADAAGSKLRFALFVLRFALHGDFDRVVIGHINFAPLGVFSGWLLRARTVLVIHGIDAWQPHPNLMVRLTVKRMDRVIGVSALTNERFASWSGVDGKCLRLLPNCVDMVEFTPGPKPMDLAEQLGLSDRTVIMTLGRLASEERYKGFDEVIEVLPELSREIPDIAYLICGDGADRGRLEAKARTLGVADRVMFAGFVSERRKADYYRLADAYVMPSRGEGFGIVFLEALACGLPVLGSKLDGGREALLNGVLGDLVDPADKKQLVEKILRTIGRGRRLQPELATFSVDAYAGRVSEIFSDLTQAAEQE